MNRVMLAMLMAAGAWLACLFAGLPPAAHAENLGPGGGSRIIVGDEVVGPYRLLVTTTPEPAQVGTVTFVVRISDPSSDEKVLDADVAVELVHTENGIRLTGDATHNNAGNPIDYAAHMQIDNPGVYNAVIRISGPAGPAEVTFTQRVAARRSLGTLVWVGLPFVIVLGILASIWFGRSGSRRP